MGRIMNNFLESDQKAKDFFNLKEAKSRGHYKADIFVDVYEDDYEQGEGDNVNSYTLATLTNQSFRGLVNELEDYVGEKRGWECANINNYEWASEIHTSQLQDSYGNEASKYDIDMWKDGNKQLYSAHFHILVSRVGESPVSADEFKAVGLKLSESKHKKDFPKVKEGNIFKSYYYQNLQDSHKDRDLSYPIPMKIGDAKYMDIKDESIEALVLWANRNGLITYSEVR